jgi:hemoglobin-like flavoprotein
MLSLTNTVFFVPGRYGVQPEMFTIMGECLIEMLAELLPNGLSTEAEAAWQTTYKELSQDMIRAYVS